MMTSCKNNKIKLQMIGSCMELHVVANWVVTYYKISFSGVGLIYVILLYFHYCEVWFDLWAFSSTLMFNL
jgi:hypothetical protein